MHPAAKQVAVLCGALALWLLLASTLVMLKLERALAAAGDSGTVYVMDKVLLDVAAEDAVKAKERALQEGPLRALQAMFRRLATFRAYDHLPTLTARDAETVVEGFSVRSERNSQTRYVALIDYSFSRPRLEALLTRKGIPFFTGRSQPQTILVVRDGSAGGEAGADEAWWQAWRSLDVRHGLTDSRLLRGKQSDNDAWAQIAAGNTVPYAPLAGRYPPGRVILASVAIEAAQRKLTLRLYGEDQAGFIDYSQQMPIDASTNAAMQMAARVAHGIIEARWREANIEGDVIAPAIENQPVENASLAARLVEETVFLRVAFNGLRDWQKMRGQLQGLPGVRDMQVNSLSAKGADVRLSFPGGVARLSSQLASAGFSLEREGTDYVLRARH